jgi:hypothetical protein
MYLSNSMPLNATFNLTHSLEAISSESRSFVLVYQYEFSVTGYRDDWKSIMIA